MYHKLSFLSLLLVCSQVYAQNTSSLYYDLSLEELLNINITVTVASKSKQELLKASGTVYVLTEKDFQNYGWRTVGEALQALPGLELSMNYRYLDGGHRGFGNDFSETILLLDGREIQKLRNGRASQPLIAYPLHNVARIEVLQGPASTLYGSHALQGVISIVTKTADADLPVDDGSDLTGSIIYGDADTQQFSVEAYKKTGDLYVGASAHKFYSDRDWDELGEFYANPANIRQDDEGSHDLLLNTDAGDFNNREQDNSIQLHIEYKGIYGGVHFFENDNLHTPGNGGFSGAFRAGIQERIFYLGYRHDFNKDVNAYLEMERLFQRDEYFNVHLRDSIANLGITDPVLFDDLDRLAVYDFDDVQRWDTEVFKYKGKLNARIGQHNLLIIGFDIWDGDYSYAQGVNTFYALDSDEVDWPNTDNEKYSLFIQDQLQLFNKRLTILAGIRFNKEDFVDNSTTPRLSIVGEPIKDSVFKLTYSEGFRSLGFGQFGQAVGSVDPTEMKMLELNYSQRYISADWQLMNSLSWYKMEQKGVLSTAPTPDNVGIIWKNTGEERKINGIENFLRLESERWSGFFSLYWIDPNEESVTESGERYIVNIPEFKMKLGISAAVSSHIQLNAFVDHWDETQWEIDNYDVDTRTILPGKTLYTQSSFTTINANIRFKALSLADAGNTKFDITVAIDNLTDKEYVHHIRPWTAQGFRQPPRRFWVKLDIGF